MWLDDGNNRRLPRSSIQFSLRTIRLFVVCCGIYLAWLNFFGWPGPYVLYLGMLGLASISVIALAAAPRRLAMRCSPYDLVILGWMLLGVNWCEGMRAIFFDVDAASGDVGDVLQITWRFVGGDILSLLTLPLFCTLPIVIDLAVRRRAKPSPMTWWLMVGLVVLLADAAIYLFALRGLAITLR